jgi:MerR family transcriptional regulator, copper efflux regulator
MSTMRVSQLADRSGVPATTLRFYEAAGLLPAERTAAGHRVYGEEAVERLAFIGAAKRLGLSLEEISDVLSVWESGACADVKADLRPRIAARIAEAEQRSAELAASTATMRAAVDRLDTMPDRAGRCGPECGSVIPEVPAAVRAEAEAVCSLTGPAMAERADQWRALLSGAERREIPDGVRLSLPASRTVAVAGLAAAEQKCCAFFDFRLHLDGSALHLEVRAPGDRAGLLAELFGTAA